MDQKAANNSSPIPPDVRTFLENILYDVGIANVDEQMHEGMLQDLYVRLDQFIAAKIVDSVPQEHLDEFIKLNEEEKSSEDVQKFLLEKVPQSRDVMRKAFLEFRDIYISNFAKAKKEQTSQA